MSLSALPPPTDQALAIFDGWRSTDKSLMVNALAGCGKTTLLRGLAQVMSEGPRVPTLVLAFNKKNVDDLKEVMPIHFDVATLNSIGLKALKRALSRSLRVDDKKLSIILGVVTAGPTKLEGDRWLDLMNLVRTARTVGLMHSRFGAYRTLIPDTREGWEQVADSQLIKLDDELFNWARKCLEESILMVLQKGIVDFDDMIYLPALGLGNFERYPVVMTDESQDLSPLNHIMIKKSLSLGGRFVIVGDPKQAIYAFRGASTKSMGDIEKLLPEGSFLHYPLSLTFRCSKVVVERSQGHAPGFKAAPGNLEGSLLDLRSKEWGIDSLPSGKVAILCRNTAPLLRVAFRMIRAGIGVTMLGRDFGKTLWRALVKVAGDNETYPVEEVIKKVDDWFGEEVKELILKGKEQMISAVEDRYECFKALCEITGVRTLGDVRRKIVDLFEDQTGRFILGTAHRAKGMEWDAVVHLDPWRIPSRWAQKAQEAGDEGPMEQEKNLRYVLETRTKDLLVLADLKEFEP